LGGGALVLGIVLLAPWVIHRFESASERSRSFATSQATSQKTPPDATAGQSISQQTEEEKTAALVNRGAEALEKGNLPEAILLYQEALRIAPDDEGLHYNLGIAYARQGMTEKALEHYGEALRLFPDHVEAHNNLGNLLMRAGRLDEAVDHFRAAVKVMPDYASGYNNLGTALQQQQDKLDEATRQFEKAVALNPDYWEARFNLGQSYLLQGHTEKARVELHKVLQTHPDFQPAWLALERAGEPLPITQRPPP
jgi:type IV pilus biogenesis/stability protein PilW